MVLVEAELALATAMLGLPAAPRFAETRQRPLAFLTQAREDLRGCVSATPPPPKIPQPHASSAALGLVAAPRGIVRTHGHFPCRWPQRLLRISPPGN